MTEHNRKVSNLADGFPVDGAVVKSAGRALEVFEYFAAQQRAVTVADVTNALGYPQSSTSVLLKSLTNLGYLEYDPRTRCYVPTLRIALLGSWIQDSFFRRDNLLDLMRALSQKLEGSVIIGLQNGIFAQYIMMLDARRPTRLLSPTGSLRPLCRSAIGHMLLTTKPDGEIVGILRRSNAHETEPENRMSQRTLLAGINLCRERGYAFTEGTMTPGHGVIAVLLPTTPGHAPMAIGVGGTITEIRKSRERILEVLRRQIEDTYQVRGPID